MQPEIAANSDSINRTSHASRKLKDAASNNTTRLTWLLFAAVCAIYFYGLGALPFVGPDEPRYAQVAREMWLRSDFVTPTLGGRTWFEKPALTYWLMRVGYDFFGVGEYAARAGSALMGAMCVLCVWYVAHRVERVAGASWREFGLTCAGVAASSLGMMIFSRGASFDIYITATIAVALACFFISEIEVDTRRRRILILGCYAAMGAALLAKGLIGVVLPAGIIGFYFILRRRLPDRFLWRSLAPGIFLTLVVASLWYAPVIIKHGWTFVDEFFIQHHFARYTSNKYRHPQPFFFYLPVMFALALPWSFVLLGATWKAIRDALRKKHAKRRPNAHKRIDEAGEVVTRLRLFALAWMVFPVMFFSLSGSKLPGYVLPALPGAALLVGVRLMEMRRSERRHVSFIVTGVFLLAFAVGIVVFITREEIVSTWIAMLIALPIALGVAAAILLAHRTRQAAWAIIAASLLTIVLAVNFLGARAGDLYSLRNQLAEASKRGYSNAPLYGLYEIDRTAEFYHGAHIIYDAQGNPLKTWSASEIATLMRASGETQALVTTNADGASQLASNDLLTAEIIGGNTEATLVGVRLKNNE